MDKNLTHEKIRYPSILKDYYNITTRIAGLLEESIQLSVVKKKGMVAISEAEKGRYYE